MIRTNGEREKGEISASRDDENVTCNVNFLSINVLTS